MSKEEPTNTTGEPLQVPEYSVRMEYGGIRKRLTLGTALKEEAAWKAREI